MSEREETAIAFDDELAEIEAAVSRQCCESLVWLVLVVSTGSTCAHERILCGNLKLVVLARGLHSSCVWRDCRRDVKSQSLRKDACLKMTVSCDDDGKCGLHSAFWLAKLADKVCLFQLRGDLEVENANVGVV